MMSSTVGMTLSRHELPRYNFPDIDDDLERAPVDPSELRERYIGGLAVLALT
jgi:hypothetical protein